MLKNKQHNVSTTCHPIHITLLTLAADESYHVAKVYKDLSDRLSEFGKMVIDLELSKKQAVESKDYDEAEKIKVTTIN